LNTVDERDGRWNLDPMGRARFAKIVVPLIVWLLVPTSAASRALEITRWDPREDALVDVLRTSKNKVRIDGAPTRLRFKVIATISNEWSVTVYLDTHGDLGADYRLRNFEAFGRSWCRIWRLPNSDPRPIRCGLKRIDDVLLARLSWTVSRSRLAPDRVVRWRVHTHDIGFDPRGRHDDRAPDAGWDP
jgi:hypothetical protein